MKKVLQALSFSIVGLTAIAQPKPALTHHVILISIDGFRPEMYQDKGWPTPNLQYLMRQGSYAAHLKSVFPAYTYPSHTAMVTGALPARSGIYFNQPKNSHGNWNWFTDSVKVPTIWWACRKAGLQTASVEWPCSVNAPIDENLPEIWDNDHPDDRITYARKYATPGLVAELEQNVTGTLDSNAMRDGNFSLDENAGRIAGYIFRKYKPALLTLHFAEVDGEEHDYGRDGDSVRMAVATDDRAIGDVLEAVRTCGLWDSTTVIIVGDHGFCDIHQVFRPNILIRDLPARFITSGGSAFLYAKKDTPRLAELVRERLDKLPTDQRKLFRIVDRHELDRMGADSAAVFALAATPGLVFSGSLGKAASIINNGPGTSIQQNPSEGLFFLTSGGHHGYDPNIPEMYTGFIAIGPGIRKGGRIEELSEPDIAPLIATLLGFPFNAPDGKLPQGLLETNPIETNLIETKNP
jgi:predicted AlkP superfamily pyrophosphatase or phosphodiesterase